MDKATKRAITEAVERVHRVETATSRLTSSLLEAQEALPTFEHIGVTARDKSGQLRTHATTTALADTLNTLQYDVAEGPCWDSLGVEAVVVAPRIHHDHRWPTYGPRAVLMGLRSQISVGVKTLNHGITGSVSFYSTDADNIDPADVTTAAHFAIQAITILGAEQHIAALNDAVATRQLVGQAIGMLMERYRIDEQAAKSFLWRASSHNNTKVRDLAASLVAEDTPGWLEPDPGTEHAAAIRADVRPSTRDRQ